ncbi:bifunctional acetate--CoA ligase family protein/GNAT family N-acetyltransferase [Egicoccus halophilus]|uniref:GNAT family N-acetyltransferase n=1 Tax=Egicoccus halophilus TaxID=1670830 RepID=A0A8J3ESG8_9ACTN|nr:GNAT family N-acetyltransferase [Egicoccus halophilus]GGI02641.1 GNAT family N-acetyltransferase [Egicoccus halophilus]
MDHEHDHVLPDGTTVRIRPITPDDKPLLLAMWARTSTESRRARFLGPFNLDESNVARFTDLDPTMQFALVALRGRGEGQQMIAVARYERDPDRMTSAEFAALVEDAHQGRGVGTALVRGLAQAAADAGITHLSGDILSDNTRMLNLVRELGLEYRSDRDFGGVVRSDLEVSITERFLDVVATQERAAAEAALKRFFRPEKVAVVGASRNRLSIGGLVFDNILEGGFTGVVYPVNPNAPYVQGVAAYPSLSDCPDVPDLVYVCVPSRFVNDVVDEAGELGVKAVCVISAGFSEVGEEGEALQDDLMERARGHGLRIVGPNCMGLLNGNADVRMNGTFSQTFPQPGRVSMSSQSGALGLAVLEHVNNLGLGISTFVSVGNKADISGNDLLMYWEQDTDTDVILMYLESFGNPRTFSRVARRVSRQKPIVAVKSGRTSAGVRAASSHTAAISSGDTAVEALFRQTGVIRTDTLEEMFDVATLLSSQGLPSGNKVAILTNAGGPGILAADALEANGLEVPPLSDRTIEQLREFLPAEAGVGNPVDMIASASPASYARAMEVLGNADEIDMVFVIFIPTGTTATEDVASSLIEAKAKLPESVPVVSVFMSATGIPTDLAEAQIPSFAFPEAAARAMGRVATYSSWRRRPLGDVVEPDGLDRDGARRIVDRALADAGEDGTLWMSSETAEELLRTYGVPLARSRVVAGAEAGARTQEEFGTPVAVKVAAPIHKTDVGGIELGLDSPEAVSEAIERIRTALIEADLAEHADAFLIQEMVGDGLEMVVGVTHDPSFGPIVMAGMGGTLVELLRDVSIRITPLTDQDVEDMLADLRMAPLLTGYRGAPPADVTALKDLLFRINAMVEDLPEVAELDLNPIFVRPDGQGVVGVDVRLKLARS